MLSLGRSHFTIQQIPCHHQIKGICCAKRYIGKDLRTVKSLKKRFVALCMLALLAAPVVSNVLPKDWKEPGISTCNAGPGSPWTDGTTLGDVETY